MNLSEILEQLEQGVVGTSIEKSASEVSKETPDGAEHFTKTASALKEAEELGAKVAAQLLKQAEDEKSEDESKEKEEDEGEKQQNSNKEENMDKKASLVDIISGLLEKSALEGDANTQNGIGTAVPNKAAVDSAAMVGFQDATIAPTPTTTGNNGSGGTVNQILDAIVAKAQAAGAVSEDQVTPAPFSSGEGASDSVEKTAAVVALVESGVDFDDAVSLVKQAELEINMDQMEIEKIAATAELMEAGVDFDTAVDLVKEASMHQPVAGLGIAASILNAIKGAPGRVGAAYTSAATKANKAIQDATGATNWSELANKAKSKVTTPFKGSIDSAMYHGKRVATGSNAGRLAHLGELAKNRAVQLGAGTAAAGGAAYAIGREKKAAFDALVAEGVDFDSAAVMVSQASQELYGR